MQFDQVTGCYEYVVLELAIVINIMQLLFPKRVREMSSQLFVCKGIDR